MCERSVVSPLVNLFFVVAFLRLIDLVCSPWVRYARDGSSDEQEVPKEQTGTLQETVHQRQN